MEDKAITLIVGSDSLIGCTLMAHLKQIGKKVVGTTRRREALDKFHLYLDLSEDIEEWECLWPVDVVVVCAGVTKIDACMEDPIKSSRINVYGVSSLIKNLISKGIFVIYLSSNHVFDGSKPFCLPNDPYSPVTEYGRQKAEVERQISQWGNAVSIIRFSKILGPDNLLFSRWRKALKNNKIINPYSDRYLAPVPLSFAVTVLAQVARQCLSGILQVSGDRDVSYYEAARFGAQLLGVNEDLVKPIMLSSSDSYPHVEGYLTHTTLDISRLKSELGLEPPDVFWTFKSIFINPQTL